MTEVWRAERKRFDFNGRTRAVDLVIGEDKIGCSLGVLRLFDNLGRRFPDNRLALNRSRDIENKHIDGENKQRREQFYK